MKDKIREHVKGLYRSPGRGKKRQALDKALFIEDYGMEGDSHAGKNQTQVAFIDLEYYEANKDRSGQSLEPPCFGENITSQGINIFEISYGNRFSIGEVEFQITKIGRDCNPYCRIRNRIGHCAIPLEGFFARVLSGGWVELGDPIIFHEEE